MTSPRSYDGSGYYPPSFSSGTPIYDSLVAERGVPQIAPINVPAALPPAPAATPSYAQAPYAPAMESTSLLPALPPARLALGPGTGGGYQPAPPAPGYPGQPYVPAPRVPGAPIPPGYPQPAAPQAWGQQPGQFHPAAPAGPAQMAPMRPMPPQPFLQQPGQPQPQQPQPTMQFGQQPYPQQQPYPGQVY